MLSECGIGEAGKYFPNAVREAFAVYLKLPRDTADDECFWINGPPCPNKSNYP